MEETISSFDKFYFEPETWTNVFFKTIYTICFSLYKRKFLIKDRKAHTHTNTHTRKRETHTHKTHSEGLSEELR